MQRSLGCPAIRHSDTCVEGAPATILERLPCCYIDCDNANLESIFTVRITLKWYSDGWCKLVTKRVLLLLSQEIGCCRFDDRCSCPGQLASRGKGSPIASSSSSSMWWFSWFFPPHSFYSCGTFVSSGKATFDSVFVSHLATVAKVPLKLDLWRHFGARIQIWAQIHVGIIAPDCLMHSQSFKSSTARCDWLGFWNGLLQDIPLVVIQLKPLQYIVCVWGRGRVRRFWALWTKYPIGFSGLPGYCTRRSQPTCQMMALLFRVLVLADLRKTTLKECLFSVAVLVVQLICLQLFLEASRLKILHISFQQCRNKWEVSYKTSKDASKSQERFLSGSIL